MIKITKLIEDINPFNRSFYVIDNDHFLLALSAFFWVITVVIAFTFTVLGIGSLFILVKSFVFSLSFSVSIRVYDALMFMIKKRNS